MSVLTQKFTVGTHVENHTKTQTTGHLNKQINKTSVQEHFTQVQGCSHVLKSK